MRMMRLAVMAPMYWPAMLRMDVGVHDETQHDLEQKVDGKRRNGTLRQEQVAAEEKERRHGADVHFLSVLRVTGRWK